MWRELERKLQKRVGNAQKQMAVVKGLVSQKQQTGLDLRAGVEHYGDALEKQVQERLNTAAQEALVIGGSNQVSKLSKRPKPVSKVKTTKNSVRSGTKKQRDVASPLRTKRVSPRRRQSPPPSPGRRSGSDGLGVISPCGSYMEN